MQISKQRVHYLEFMLTPGKRSISAERMVLVQRLRSPKTVKPLRAFLRGS